MNVPTLIARFRDRIERRSEYRLSPDLASEWKEEIVPGEETFSDCPVPATRREKGSHPGGRLLRGISNLTMSIRDTSWCQSEVQFFNDYCRKNLLGRW